MRRLCRIFPYNLRMRPRNRRNGKRQPQPEPSRVSTTASLTMVRQPGPASPPMVGDVRVVLPATSGRGQVAPIAAVGAHGDDLTLVPDVQPPGAGLGGGGG